MKRAATRAFQLSWRGCLVILPQILGEKSALLLLINLLTREVLVLVLEVAQVGRAQGVVWRMVLPPLHKLVKGVTLTMTLRQHNV